MSRFASLALLAACALAPGCFFNRSHLNRPLSPVDVAKLEPGQSTADDVARVLGAPTDVVQLGQRSAWRYDHTREKTAGLWLGVVMLIGAESQQDRVWAFFDEEGTLTHLGATLDADRAKYAVPPLSPGGDG